MLQTKLAEFKARRAQYGELPKGTAPVISSMDFRGNVKTSSQLSISLEHRWTREARLRTKSTLKAASTSRVRDMISLGTARPNSIYFPFERLAFDVQDPPKQGTGAADDGTALECQRDEKAYPLDIAMNYGYAAGSPQLLRFVTEHVELVHSPQYTLTEDDWQVALTCGTTSALDIVLRMLCEQGESVLVEEYTYSGMIEAAGALGVRLVGVGMDEGGLDPDALERVLNGPVRPKVLYTIPSGQNPTGVTQTLERRKAIYAVAEKHDILIIEDDPYYFLQLGAGPRIVEEYLSNLPPSYLSLDRSGRVIRLDATSKILAPGLRVGWITACSAIVEKFLAFTEFSTVAPSGPSQVMLYKLLDQGWGHEGFLRWLMQLSQRYSRCRDVLSDACKRHLPEGLCRWNLPLCGMFMWLQIDWRSCRLSTTILEAAGFREVVLDLEERIHARAMANGVQISKGSWFNAGQQSTDKLAFRLTFAASLPETLDEAVKRFAQALRDEVIRCGTF